MKLNTATIVTRCSVLIVWTFQSTITLALNVVPKASTNGMITAYIYLLKGDNVLNDKQFDKFTQYQIDKEQLRLIREDRNELMEQIKDLDRLEVSVIKMMGGAK